MGCGLWRRDAIGGLDRVLTSMKTVDQSFHVPRVPVAVIDCGATGEALLLRGLLENMGAVVTLHQPGTPRDFLLVLGKEMARRPLW